MEPWLILIGILAAVYVTTIMICSRWARPHIVKFFDWLDRK